MANATSSSYYDASLSQNTLYNYQVQAFDMANNNSAKSNTLGLTTYRDAPPPSPNDVKAAALSSHEIQLTWEAPTGGGITQYQVYAGTSPKDLPEAATTPSDVTKWNDQPLQPSTKYYFGVVAVAEGLSSPMSAIVSAATEP
jgi:hypothetical protein